MKNIVLFICDSLRYDHGGFFLDLLRKPTFVIKGLTAGLCTPPSIASIFTAMSPLEHNVCDFFNRIDIKETPFPMFEDFEFYSYIYDPIRCVMLNLKGKQRKIREMNEPFIWIERLMETHYPYGQIFFGKFPKDGTIGLDYFDMLRKKGASIIDEYRKGVLKAKEHIKIRLLELKLSNLLDRTQVIITSDHGEILDNRYPSPHGFPPCKDLVEVPIIFSPPNNLPRVMRLRDVLPTALDIFGLEWRREQSVKDKDIHVVREVCSSCDVLRNLLTIWECSLDETKMVGIYEDNSFRRILKRFLLSQLMSPAKATLIAKAYRFARKASPGITGLLARAL